jgi:hypothetical protein
VPKILTSGSYDFSNFHVANHASKAPINCNNEENLNACYMMWIVKEHWRNAHLKCSTNRIYINYKNQRLQKVLDAILRYLQKARRRR